MKKNELKPELNENIITETMKPIYSYDLELMCGIITYNEKKYYMDIDDRDLILNFNKKFKFAKEDDIYPSYSINYKRTDYLEFIYKFKSDNLYYIFKNDNNLDLRKINVEFFPIYNKTILENYETSEYIQGHSSNMGHEANIMKNPLWKIQENGKEYLLMYCEKETLCKLCPVSYQKILDYELNENNGKKITWFKSQNGYIMGSNNIYMHRLIKNCHEITEENKHTIIEHIDVDTSNNSWENLQVKINTETKYYETILEKYKDAELIKGHYYSIGHHANIMKNPLWKIQENGKEYLLMYCEKDTLCKVCPVSYQKILDYELNENNGKKITWFKSQNGYIMGSNNMYIHQIITDCYGNGKGTKNISVDHIDRDSLNNSWENLRIATREQQEQNSKGISEGTKRARKANAKPLPEGITTENMRKYVVYYHEWLNPEKTRSREFFKIEKNPKLEKTWIGTKSNKVTIQDKLAEANAYADELNKN